MRTAKALSFLPGIRKLAAEAARLRESCAEQREIIRELRAERRALKTQLSDLRKRHTRTLLELQTEPSYARRALQSVLDGGAEEGDLPFPEETVSVDLDVEDDMLWKTTTRHYFRAGFEAVRLIDRFHRRHNIDPAAIESVLDLPSGFGRVTRFLRAWLPNANLLVCDLQEAGARFCAAKFGAEVVPAAELPEEIEIETPVNLIWCGSLVTHLDADRYRGFVERFGEFLAPGGLLFFSNHGERAVERLTSGKTDYGLSGEAQSGVIEDWKRDGFGYRDYPKQDGYGISLANREWVEDCVRAIDGLELADYLPREWAGHHDVAICRKL